MLLSRVRGSQSTPFLTLKERDVETGLDYFGARYYSSVQGRFSGPDRLFVVQSTEDPQSWNLYTYVKNNPYDSSILRDWVIMTPTGIGLVIKTANTIRIFPATWRADNSRASGGYRDFGGDQTPFTTTVADGVEVVFRTSGCTKRARRQNHSLRDRPDRRWIFSTLKQKYLCYSASTPPKRSGPTCDLNTKPTLDHQP